VNDEMLSTRRNITSFNTIDSFNHNGDHFDVEIDTESLMPFKINCSVFINGQWGGTKLVVQDLNNSSMTITEEPASSSLERMLDRYLQLGKKELNEYDLEHAALHFDKAMMIKPDSSETYYFKACICSLNEDLPGAFNNLEKAIELGMNGRQRILEDGHLAFIRITQEFEAFKEKYFK
jgi:tetratricopeptide (TPR) repeat protein